MVDALSEARAIQLDAAKTGFDWPNVGGALAKLREEIDELGHTIDSGRLDERREELGDVLFSVVNVSRFIGVDASDALDAANRKFSARFRRVRDEVRNAGREMNECSLEELDAIWERAKSCTSGDGAGRD